MLGSIGNLRTLIVRRHNRCCHVLSALDAGQGGWAVSGGKEREGKGEGEGETSACISQLILVTMTLRNIYSALTKRLKYSGAGYKLEQLVSWLLNDVQNFNMNPQLYTNTGCIGLCLSIWHKMGFWVFLKFIPSKEQRSILLLGFQPSF